MTPEQERAEAREVLRKLENGEGIKTGVYLFFPAWLRNSLDREEQLIAENERLNHEAEYSDLMRLEALKLYDIINKHSAEQDKEIQRLRKVEEDYKALQQIMDRARRLAFLAQEDEEPGPRFKMDANGNLTRIED